MQHKQIRIALTDQSLLETLRRLHSEPEYILSAPEALGDLVGKVEIFLLDDDTAIRFLGTRSEASWPSVIVVAKEGQAVPASFRQGLADDLLVLPARALDLERMFRTNEWMQALRVLEENSRGVTGLVHQLQEDVSLAQKIQRRLIREKFPPLGPLSVKSKYWCGLKNGGDYFDFFEFPGDTHAGLILSNSSSYSLSTGLIGSLIQFSSKMDRDDLENPDRIVKALFGKVRESMKEKDRLSLLYGVLDRKTFAMRFVDCGGVYMAKRGAKGKMSWACQGDNPALSMANAEVPKTREIMLEPGDRMLVCSGGWGEALERPMPELMEKFLMPERDPQELMNDMAFQLRRGLELAEGSPPGAEEDFPMPPQDCSAILFDLATNMLRLAR